MDISRRTFIAQSALAGVGMALKPVFSFNERKQIEWVTTTKDTPWKLQSGLNISEGYGGGVLVHKERPLQTIEGFGACFNELGWDALSSLAVDEKESIFEELFSPKVGANFSICRMPLGANDFSRDWYSFNETEGDFELKEFSIKNDLDTLVPYIKNAKKYRPDLRLWASPWSPPTWMKYNKHYAATQNDPNSEFYNGLRADQVGLEGTDMFIQQEKYYKTYARYFGKFIDAYKEQNIPIEMVMPQNEFNSAQTFPSCTWTPEGLANFMEHLAPEMNKRDVDLFIGTMERPNEKLVEIMMENPAVAKNVSGVGFQWAGKGAIPWLNRTYPELKMYQTEQECGDGRNDWRFCRYAWNMMKHYLNNGTNVYLYWNMALKKGGVSRWGWAQNSLVTVDTENKTYKFNHEYYLMKHLSHYVQPGARRIEATSWTGYENQLAFSNPDGSTVVVIQNDMSEDMPVNITIGDHYLSPVLPADSFNTIFIPA